jgi:hypothetical protein
MLVKGSTNFFANLGSCGHNSPSFVFFLIKSFSYKFDDFNQRPVVIQRC